MHEINANILQRFFISLILFLFFNVSLIKKCEALRIKIKVLDFINDIGQNRRRNESSSTQKKESSIQTVI